jgi:hypothetical protein
VSNLGFGVLVKWTVLLVSSWEDTTGTRKIGAGQNLWRYAENRIAAWLIHGRLWMKRSLTVTRCYDTK